ncbi:binding-protein-dependent transport systems inner membrane component [Pirellula staleyi DSM 6068]|uniref:Binding-protein-dependent transport systems inner membrane component n=1 Tax=Pirellula staleyi (strain ATCC 27377 / DSM 6068 / ICPB 4128) TaxID=530564 RepID=D2R1C6_PIRSD|nr:ABC transporter permease subunit [Pirellula staleyi]ADB14911.1 binding-protein-dependent transport systems inner membrane component [Pirellula staleyi DSM 6068]
MNLLLHFLSLLVKRIAWMALTLWVVFTISFLLMYSVPGGPFSSEKKLPPAIQRNIDAKYKFDDPLILQYRDLLLDYLRLDFRASFKIEDFTVNEIIAQSFPASAALGIISLTLALVVGMTAGVISAVNRNTPIDYFFMSIATLGIAIPLFVLSTIAVLVVVFGLGLLPPAGWGAMNQIILPACCLAAPYAAYIARLTRAGMLDVLSLDYIRTAYAKGLAPRTVIVRHALQGALLPVVSFIGPAAAGILTGSLVVERIFNIPGMGSFFVEAAQQRDYTLAMGMVMLYTFMVYLLNMMVDLSYAILDPRVKMS